MLAESCSTLIRLEPADLQRAFQVFATFADKRWSFVDCSSFAVMERLGHAQIQTTQKYLHALPEADQKNLEALDRMTAPRP